MNNILHLIDTSGPGGAETVVLELAKGVDRRRWRSFFAIPETLWLYDNLVANGFEPTLTPLHGAFDVRYLAGVCKIVKQHRIELIHTHLFTAAVYGGLAGRLCGVPVLSTLHGHTDVFTSGKYRALKLWLMRHSVAKAVFVSESLRRLLLSIGHFDARRTSVIANGIDESVFMPRSDSALRRELGISPDDVLVGAVGNLRYAKSYDVLLKAAALLRQQSPHYRFVVVGEARGALYDELVALRDRLNLSAAVTFTGFKDRIHDVMNNLDVYVSTSSSEGFSLSVIQAMACGVPVVATKSGGPEEIIRHDVTGLLVDVNNPEQVAHAVHRLSNEPATRARLVVAARKVVEERFTINRMVASYERLYQQLVRHEQRAVDPSSPHQGRGAPLRDTAQSWAELP